jgi:hypothetical protein
MRRAYLCILLFPLFLLLLSCATRTEITEEGRDADILLAKLNMYNASIHSIQANALVLYTDGDRTYSFRAKLVVNMNGQNMRLDLADFVFKKPLLTIVKSEGDITALIHTQKKYYLTSFEDFRIEDLTDLRMKKEILLPALMGKVYVASERSIVTSPDEETLIIEHEDFRQTVSFSKEWLPQSAQYTYGYDVYSLTLDSFTYTSEVYFPERVVLVNKNRQLKASYTDVQVNGTVDSQIFNVDEKEIAGYTNGAL